MHKLRKQSDTTYPLFFFMVDSTDHVTGKTGLTCTVTISKNGGSFASPSGSVSEIANGWYKVAGNATDSNTLGELMVHATGTAADPTDVAYTVVPYDPFDATRLGLTALPNAAAAASGGLPTVDGSNAVKVQSGTGANQLSLSSGVIDASVTKWSGTTVASPDTAGYPKVTVKSGTGTGEVNLTSGVADSNVTKWSGTSVASPDTAGYPKVTLKSGTGTGELSLSSGTITVGTNNDKTGYALSSGGVDAIWAKAMQDLASVPAATASVLDAINWVYEILRNKRTQTSTTETVYKNDSSTTLATSTKSDNGTTSTLGKYS